MEQRIIAQFADDCGCSVTGGDKGFTFSRCKLHAAAPALLAALKAANGMLDSVMHDYKCPDPEHDDFCITFRDADRIQEQAREAIEAAK